MKKIQITLSFDTSDADQMDALTKILEIVTGVEADTASAPEPVAKKKEPSKAKSEITIDQLRELTKEKSSDTALRPKIKAKLKELGADTVSSLTVDNFQEYKTFIENL